jgi:hypothetical protein
MMPNIQITAVKRKCESQFLWHEGFFGALINCHQRHDMMGMIDDQYFHHTKLHCNNPIIMAVYQALMLCRNKVALFHLAEHLTGGQPDTFLTLPCRDKQSAGDYQMKGGPAVTCSTGGCHWLCFSQ